MTKNTIKTKLLIFIILLGLIPLIIIGYFGYSISYDLIMEREKEKVAFFFDNIEGKLTKFFCNTQKDLIFLRDITSDNLDSANSDLDSLNKNKLENIYYNFSKSNIQYDQIRFIGKDGFEKIRINNDGKKPYVVPKKQLQYKGNRYYFEKSYNLKKEEMYISDIDLNREKGEIEKPLKPMIRFTTPLYKGDELKGFLVVNLNVKYILKDIENLKEQNKYNNLIITDKDGYYLLNPEKSKEWGSSKDLDTGANFKKDYPSLYNIIDKSTSMLIKRVDSNILASYPIKLKCLEDKKLTLFLTIGQKYYMEPVIKFRNFFIVIILISIILLLIIGNLISKRLTNPILNIVRAVNNIGKGHFDINLEINTKDELEDLSIEITNMSQELKRMYMNMEDLVDERTKELKLAHEELEEMAIKDPLTGLYNRHYFNEVIENILDEDKDLSNDEIWMFLMIDIDSFKSINDTYGHNIGDIVLKDVADILKGSSRENDIVVRYGGDEFLVILQGSHKDGTEKYISRVKDKLYRWNQDENILDHNLTLSIGYSGYKESSSILEVISDADKMMYENKMNKKRQGK